MILWKFHRSRYFNDSGIFSIKTIQYFWKRISLWYLVLYYWFLVSIASRSEILDFGTISVFSEMFSRMIDFHLGIRVSNIFIFRVREISYLFQFFSFFLFPFPLILHHTFLYFTLKLCHLITSTSPFHTLPLFSTTHFLHLTPHMASPYWLERTPHPLFGTLWLAKSSPFAQKPLTII